MYDLYWSLLLSRGQASIIGSQLIVMRLQLLRIHHLHIFVFVVDYLLAIADQLTQENQRKPGLRYIFIGRACVALAGLFCTRWSL